MCMWEPTMTLPNSVNGQSSPAQKYCNANF